MTESLPQLSEVLGHHGHLVQYFRKQVMGWTQEHLAEALSVSVRWVQEMESMPFIRSLSRRKALAAILSIPPALLHLEGVLFSLPGPRSQLSPSILESLEVGTRLRWQGYYAKANQVSEEGLLEEMEILEQLADDQGVDIPRVACVLSQDYQLAGTLARDAFYYSRAKKYFREAERLAQEAGSTDLRVTAVARHALVLLRQERVEDARCLYEGAADLARQAEPQVCAYALSGLAETYARLGEQSLCFWALDQAEGLLLRAGAPSEDDHTFVRLSMPSLDDDRGECYVLLGEASKGIDLLRKAEREMDPELSRNLCRLLMQFAEAYLVAGEPDTCVDYVLRGLDLARTLGSTGNINWAQEILDKLRASVWKQEPVVGKLASAVVQ